MHIHSQTLTVSLKTGLAQWYWTREWYTLTHGSPMPAAIQFWERRRGGGGGNEICRTLCMNFYEATALSVQM